ncbi:hypothetical protein WJN01_06880 [Flavobacteriaceae bacterium SZ-1-7]|uniref:hypothetical protein n=1 Tax=Tamlana sedimenti TaxID=3134126 RepID=UPI0031222BDA
MKKTKLDIDMLVSADNFGNIYFTKSNVFYKKGEQQTTTYNNLQLGNLFSVNTFNPLKINLFYKDFNTVIILDNRLAEIFKIDFNTLSPYKNITHISTGFDNNIWLFNQDTQKLELFDYKKLITRAQTAPVQSDVLDLKSDYNWCYLLTKNYLYVYNYFGSLAKKMKNDGFTSIVVSNENIVFKKGDSLFYLSKNNNNPIRISAPNFLIKQFSLTNETLYIYDSESLHELQLKIN